MPANHKVSVGWQIVAQFIPIADLWSAYRIRNLRKYVLLVVIPHVVNSAIFIYYYYSNLKRYTMWGDDGLAFGHPTPDFAVQTVSTIISFGILALAIYLIIKWSREHNRKYDSPTQAS